MQELIARMFATLMRKKFITKQNLDCAISRMISKKMTRNEAIMSLYVSYVDEVLGVEHVVEFDQEDERQAMAHEQM